MVSPELPYIDITALENRMRELGLKNWWVADQIGVDRKTLSRWLSGQVRTIKPENLAALAECLQCESAELVLRDETEATASAEDQKSAAEKVLEDRLLETLTPLGQWPLLESIVKTTLSPNLPLPVLGKLYNLLSIAAWRQSKLEKAETYAKKASEIGERISHRAIIVGARSNLAVIASYRGDLRTSIRLYEECISEGRYLEDDRARAAALSNLAQDLQLMGDFERSGQLQLEAIEAYAKLELPTNLAIAYCGLGLLYTEQGRWADASVVIEEALRLAEKAKYARGMQAFRIYLADIRAGEGRADEARRLLAEGVRGMQGLGLNEALNFEIAGRIARLGGDLECARRELGEALKFSKGFPLEEASARLELERLELACGRRDEAAQHRKAAIEFYEKSGAESRVKRLRAGP